MSSFQQVCALGTLAALHRELGDEEEAERWDAEFLAAFEHKMFRVSRAEAIAVAAQRYVPLRRLAAVRFMAGLSPSPFTDGSLASVAIKKIHVEELRAALNQARGAVGVPAITYTDPVLTSEVTTVKAAHIEQLRTGVK